MFHLKLIAVSCSFLQLSVSDEAPHHRDGSLDSIDQDLGMIMMPVQLVTGHSVNIVYNNYNMASDSFNNYQPLCLTAKETTREQRNLQLLSQQICRSQGFKTYQNFGFVHKSQLRTGVEMIEANSSIVICNQNHLYEIVCEIIEEHNNDTECQYYLSLQCSMCHFHNSLGNSSSLSISSPLYPVLQPNNICDYDIKLDPEQNVVLTFHDLSLPGYQFSSGHDSKIFCLVFNLF